MPYKSIFMGGVFRRIVCSSLFGLVFIFSASSAIAEPVAIGRSSLTLTDLVNWKVQDLEPASVSYSGDASGAFAMGAKLLTYFSANKTTKAVFVTKVTKGGVVGVFMTWPNECANVKQDANIFKDDKGSFSAIDCLLVLRVNQFEILINALPELKKNLAGARPATPGGFYIQYSKSVGAGGYAITEALVASDFKGMEGTTFQNEANETTISPAVLSWSLAFAKNNRSAIGSMSGNWSMPALVFNQQ